MVQNEPTDLRRTMRTYKTEDTPSLAAEHALYQGYWLITWQDRAFNTVVLKDLRFLAEPLASGGAPNETEWRLEGTRPGGWSETICKSPESVCSSPDHLSFHPDYRGRAHTTMFDTWSEETVTVTSLGSNIFRALLGVDFYVSDKDQDEAVKELNQFLSEREIENIENIEFLLEATLGAYSKTVWHGSLEMVHQGMMSSMLDLAGVKLNSANYENLPETRNRWLDMIDFEGFREESPMDDSSPRPLHARSLAAFAALLNTPITISEKSLAWFVSAERESLYSARRCSRELFIAALMIHALEEYGDDSEKGRSSDEAQKLSRQILEIDPWKDWKDQLKAVEILCSAIAGWSVSLQTDALSLAGQIRGIDMREDEEEFSELVSELEQTEALLRWSVHRSALKAEIIPLLRVLGPAVTVTARDERSKFEAVFQIDMTETPNMRVSPALELKPQPFVNDFHRNQYWLRWRTEDDRFDSALIELDHRLVQFPPVIASVIAFTLRRSELFDVNHLHIETSSQ